MRLFQDYTPIPREKMNLRDRLELAVFLVIFFCRIGCFTFGGGWNIVAQMQAEFVEKRRWMTDRELLDMTAVGRSLPGTMIGNVSYLFGYHMGGILCGVAAVLGMLIMPVLILSIVTVFYEGFRDNTYVARALVGVRASVVPIIGSACLKMRKSAYPDRTAYLFTLAAVILCLFFHMNTIPVVLLGGITGYALMTRRQNRVPAADAASGQDHDTGLSSGEEEK